MVDRRHKFSNWQLGDKATGAIYSWDEVQVAVLMDIRDVLQEMNRKLSRLDCPQTLSIPGLLRSIKKNTTKRKARRTK